MRSRSAGVVRWFFTSAKPTRAGMPSARAQAASSAALPMQKPSPAVMHFDAWYVSSFEKSRNGL
ncbi:hypothetical protein D3C83_175490 [compost metagenome]